MTRKPPRDHGDIYAPRRVDDYLGDSPVALYLRGLARLLPEQDGAMAAGSADIQRPRRRDSDARA